MSKSITDNQNNDQDCLSTWKEELRKTSNALKIEQAKSDKAQITYANASVWESKLKSYWTNIQKSNEIGIKISDELKSFKKHTDIVCQKTDCSVQALELIFCLIKEFFECTDDLKEKVSDLQKQIECRNEPGLNPQSSKVLQCLKNFSDKLDLAIAGQQELIKMVINVVKCAIQIHESICSTPCGLRELLVKLIDIFEGCGDQEEVQVSSKKGHKHEDHHKDEDPECGPDNSCNAKLEPVPVMPISDDPYYTGTEDQYNKAKSEKETYKKEADEAKEKTETLASFKKSLEDAIAAAVEAKACK